MRFGHIISALPFVSAIAEVGCDHAKLTELAFERGSCERAVVSDISDKCLAKARRTLARFGDRVTYVVCDGVPPEAAGTDCIMICGMGGHTIADILSRYTGSARLLLSPQSHPELVRRMLVSRGYRIDKDECFKAAGKFYDLITAEKGEMSLDGMQEEFGTYWRHPTDALIERSEIRLKALLGGGEKTAAEADRLREVLGWQK